MSIYQFLIAVRSDGSQLTNEAGEITRYSETEMSHIHTYFMVGLNISVLP